MNPFTIDPEKCNRDEICVKACPTNVIRMPSPQEIPELTPDFENYCLVCGHCVAICPTGAFSLPWLAPENCTPVDKELALTREQGEQFLRSRRSIRTFKDKPVEREKLEKLFQMASFAPTGGNSQLLHWTVVEDSADVRQMARLVVEWMRSVMKQDPQQAEAWLLPVTVAAWDGGKEEICRGAPHVVVVHADKNWGFGAEDAALAISYLSLYALLLGLGTCWGGYFYSAVNFYPPLFEALGLPADHRAFGAVMVGYPQFRYQRLPTRNEPNVTWR